MVTTPSQTRSLDPHSYDRFSSTINRLTRIVTGGEDIIINPNEFFLVTRGSGDSTGYYTTVTVSPGICVKDDVTIQIDENYTIDLTNDDYYVDETPGLTQAGWYYLVLEYNYARSCPPQEAYYKIIKDVDTYYTPYIGNYLFLAAIYICYDADSSSYQICTNDDGYDILYYDPNDPTVTRNYPTWNISCIDGGVLPIS